MNKLFAKYLSLFLFISIGFSNFNCSKKTSVKAPSDIPLTSIDTLFKHFKVPYPGMSCAIIKDGEIVLERSYGYADVEHKTKASATSNYRLASVSKPFTALAVMKLVYQNKLSYQSTLSEIFTGFPEYGDSITVEHLLTHRSGIISYDGFVTKGEQILDEEILEELMKVNSIYFYPNEQFMYSNAGYAVLAQIVQKISKMPFSEFMEKEIFRPANMSKTTLYAKDKNIANRVFGYTIENESIRKTDQNETSAIKGDGSIYSSVNDLYAWDQALYTDAIVPQDVLDDAFYAYGKSGKTNAKGYGYGWSVLYSNDIKVLEHTGASIGFTNHVVRVPSLKLSVFVLTNRYHNFYDDVDFTNIAYTLLNIYSEGALDL